MVLRHEVENVGRVDRAEQNGKVETVEESIAVC